MSYRNFMLVEKECYNFAEIILTTKLYQKKIYAKRVLNMFDENNFFDNNIPEDYF